MARVDQVLVRLSTDETAMLGRLSEASGLARTDIIRQLIRREHERRFGKGKGKR